MSVSSAVYKLSQVEPESNENESVNAETSPRVFNVSKFGATESYLRVKIGPRAGLWTQP